MKTDELIANLAADSAPVDTARVDQRFYAKLSGGVALAIVGTLALMGPRPDFSDAAAQPMFWMKLLFPASLAVAAVVGLRRLGHPGMRLGRVCLPGSHFPSRCSG